MDIAASIQKVTEKIILKILNSLKQEFNLDNLCLAGGVALNCVANGLIQREKIFKNIWIQFLQPEMLVVQLDPHLLCGICT